MAMTLSGTTGIVTPAGVPINNAPAFSVYNSGTSVATATWTKVTFSTEEFDTNGNFASSRFTPTVAGYYLFDASIELASMTTAGALLALAKNGSFLRYGPACAAVSALGTLAGLSCIAYMNGSTDYVELYVYQNSGSTKTVGTVAENSYFQGVLVRGA